MKRSDGIWRVDGSGRLEGKSARTRFVQILTQVSGGRMCVGSHLAVYRESCPRFLPWTLALAVHHLHVRSAEARLVSGYPKRYAPLSFRQGFCLGQVKQPLRHTLISNQR